MQLKRDDRGVTLIEVLVSVVILGIIIAPLSAALIAFLRNTDDTTRRMDESHDVQITAAYFTQDVQAIGVRDWSTSPYRLRQSIELNAPFNSGLYPCGATGTPNALVRFAWDDPRSAAANPVVIAASYVVMPSTDGLEQQLHRITCADGVVQSDVVLAHNVDGVLSPPGCPTPADCTRVPLPQTVSLQLNIKDPGNTGAALAVTLTAQRRQT